MAGKLALKFIILSLLPYIYMARIIVSDGLLDSVPLELLDSWESLQTFSTDLVSLKYDTVDARDYLSQGADQDGIDVYATIRESDKLIVVQCKHAINLWPSEVEDIFKLFLSKNFATQTGIFIICTTFKLNKKNHELKISEGRKLLQALGIELKIWDPLGINSELRSELKPASVDLVARYFTHQVAEKFYGEFYTEYLKKWRRVSKHIYKHPDDYIIRKLICQYDYYNLTNHSFWLTEGDTIHLSLYEITHQEKNLSANRVLVLSIAGFGKSIELEQLAAQCSTDNERSFPILHLLKDYSGESIEQILVLHDVDWSYIQEETLLLIFDGLDEIKAKYQDDFNRQLNLFADAKPKASIIVSSRFNFYDPSVNELRGFEIFVLEEFSQTDIDQYLDLKIRGREAYFKTRLSESKLNEYAVNPFYLVRLVRLFDADVDTFPATKSAFFKQILFERLDYEQKRFGLTEGREELLLMVQKVAFCMTLCGESVINDETLAKIIPNLMDRGRLKRYFLLNKHADERQHWSFEHKNVQEYLCALSLAQMPFDKVIELVSFSTAFKKIQPKFLNTLSFLFSSPDHEMGQLLFDWLIENEPDILMRFEKSRIEKSLRTKILKSVIKHYKSKGLFFYSSVLEIGDVADFVEIEELEIEYLDEELFKHDTSDRLAYDLIKLLGKTKRPWMHKERLVEIFFNVLNDKRRSARTHADVIDALKNLEFTEELVLQKILDSSSNIDSFEVRNAIVKFLLGQRYSYRYMEFLLNSIPIYISAQKEVSYTFANENLVQALRKAATEESILQLLNFIVDHTSYLSNQNHSRTFSIDEIEFEHIIKIAASFYPKVPGVLKKVYRIFRQLEYVTNDREWFPIFKTFFQATCGDRVMFDKLDRYSARSKDAACFADKEACDWLIEEFKDGKIDEKEMMQWRNFMPREEGGIHNWFYNKLKAEFGPRFQYSDEDVDYTAIRIEYEIKNQQMILDKNLLLSEIKKIFDLIGKSELVSEDFYDYTNHRLSAHQSSLAYKKVNGSLRGNKKKSFQDFEQEFEDDKAWERFQIKRIEEIIKKKDNKVDKELIDFAKKWCHAKIEELDFSGAITDVANGGYQINNAVLFVQGLFCLLDLELSDSLLLKMLPSDIHVYDEKKESISTVISNSIKDQSLLRSTVIANIKSESLSFPALENHFGICASKGYQECLGELYRTISATDAISFYSQKTLSEHYLKLGGGVQDFKQFITIPHPYNNPHLIYEDWNWHLIRMLANTDSNFINSMMVAVIDDPYQTEQNKKEACRLLYQFGDIKALVYWIDYIILNKKLLFDAHYSPTIAQAADILGIQAIGLLTDFLKTVYSTNLHLALKRFDSVEEVIYNSLNAIAVTSKERFMLVSDELSNLQNENFPMDVLETIAYKIEGIRQNYFMKNELNLDLNDALLSFPKA